MTHQEWWSKHRAGESPELPALGLFKALRNFIHPLLKSRYKPGIGIGYRSAAVEALGDCFMYLDSVSLASGVQPKLLDVPPMVTVERAVSYMALRFSALLTDVVYFKMDPIALGLAYGAVEAACNVCGIDPAEARAASEAKLCSKL